MTRIGWGTILVMTLAAAAPSWGQVFSPGDLARPHADLEGLTNCTKCHDSGDRLNNDKCLACHKEIKRRVAKKQGYHGGPIRLKSCAECHYDHKGRNAELVRWFPVKSRFQHKKTGWPLFGTHGELKCNNCHEVRLIKDKSVRKLLKKPAKKETFLGLSKRCSACHFDEHRGQFEDTSCQDCHNESKFKPAPGFRHNRDARFSLTGRHRRVACSKCHEPERDTTTPLNAFPKPKHVQFAQYKPIPHRRCIECHRDPHRGEHGTKCQSCHSTKGWEHLNQKAMDIGFHQKTDFPLLGEHLHVDCKLCHGPFRGQRKAVYKGIDHDRCDTCHHDAHVGQLSATDWGRSFSLAKSPPPTPKAADKKTSGPDCRACHSERGFAPVFFELEDHGKTRYPLEGAHQAVACVACHEPNKGLVREVSRHVRRDLARTGRDLRVSTFPLKLPETTERCETCHDDVHSGQFDETVKAKGCNACHESTSFGSLLFDHNRDSRFALEGAHEKVECRACHRADETLKKDAKKGVDVHDVRYRPVAQECRDCHRDVHVRQFDDQAGHTDCSRCHGAVAFAPAAKFDHNSTAFTEFGLRGRHATLPCTACHAEVAINPEVKAVRYRGLPTQCAGCHEDQHHGQFDEYLP